MSWFIFILVAFCWRCNAADVQNTDLTPLQIRENWFPNGTISRLIVRGVLANFTHYYVYPKCGAGYEQVPFLSSGQFRCRRICTPPCALNSYCWNGDKCRCERGYVATSHKRDMLRGIETLLCAPDCPAACVHGCELPNICKPTVEATSIGDVLQALKDHWHLIVIVAGVLLLIGLVIWHIMTVRRQYRTPATQPGQSYMRAYRNKARADVDSNVYELPYTPDATLPTQWQSIK